MSREKRYRLADSTVIEPLVDRWSAWSYLIAPVTAGLHLLHYQLKVMESYVADPETHVKLSQDPHFSGASFMNIPSGRANEVRTLLAETKKKREASLKFASSITEFSDRLVADASGEGLKPFYEQIPESLGGYVELLYDYYNRPTVRFLAGMLYESPYYDPSLQSLSLFNLSRDNARTFFLNTPRLPEPDRLDCALPFADPHAWELFRLDSEPQPLGRIREFLNLNATEAERVLPFLSDEPVSRPQGWSGPGVRIRYFGHACVLFEWEGVSILTDPFIPVTPSAGGLERLTFRDLPEKIDYALVTHNHQDHFMIESLLRLRHRIECLVVPKTFGILHGDLSLKLMCQKLGFKRVVELDTYESISLPGGEIVAIPFLGEHADIAHGKTAYVIRAGRQQILCAADSDCLDRRIYEHVRRFFGPIETVFLGLECVGAPLSWGYGPLLPKRPSKSQEESRRQHGCDSRAALEILETIGARRFYNYAMGMEPWLEYILGLGLSKDSVQWQESDKLLANTRGRGFFSERLCGSREIFLDDAASPNRAFVSLLTPNASAPAPERVLERDVAYWRQQLAGPLPVLRFPFERVAQANAESRAARQSLTFSTDLYAAIKQLAEQEDCRALLVLLAAFEALLHRYTGEDDMIVGTLIENNPSESQPSSALNSGLLVLCTDLSGAPTFLTVLHRVRDVLAMAEAHRSLSFEALAEATQAEWGTMRPTPFQVMFVASLAESRASNGATSNPSRIESERTACDLVLSVSEVKKELSVALDYNAALFEEETSLILLRQFEALLTASVAHPTERIEELSFASDQAEAANAQTTNDAEAQFQF